jgi:hypothetical protein
LATSSRHGVTCFSPYPCTTVVNPPWVDSPTWRASA